MLIGAIRARTAIKKVTCFQHIIPENIFFKSARMRFFSPLNAPETNKGIFNFGLMESFMKNLR